jgi:uroporphyrinogen-III synthase
MTLPRVLVVRSGEKPFPAGSARRVEVVERVSHAIENVAADARDLGEPADYAIVTSRTAIARGLSGPVAGALRRSLESSRIVAVGDATADALREAGLTAATVADGSAEAVLATLPARLEGARILMPCGEDASPALAEALRGRGAAAVRCVIYRKVARPTDAEIEAELAGDRYRAFLPTSPAAARWLFESAGERGRPRLRAIPAVSLGPSTRAALEAARIERIAEAPRPRFDDALALLEELATSAPGK